MLTRLTSGSSGWAGIPLALCDILSITFSLRCLWKSVSMPQMVKILIWSLQPFHTFVFHRHQWGLKDGAGIALPWWCLISRECWAQLSFFSLAEYENRAYWKPKEHEMVSCSYHKNKHCCTITVSISTTASLISPLPPCAAPPGFLKPIFKAKNISLCIKLLCYGDKVVHNDNFKNIWFFSFLKDTTDYVAYVAKDPVNQRGMEAFSNHYVCLYDCFICTKDLLEF